MTERLSPLAEALAKRDRKQFDFNLEGVFGLANKPVEAIKIRIATKGEQDRALCGAHAYVDNLAKGAHIESRVAAEDRDILSDAKTCHILADVCRDATDPKYPAFPGPKWMIDHLSTDEIGVLLNCYHEALRKSGTVDFDLAPERVASISRLLAAASESDAPNEYLIRFSREQLVEICIRQAVMLTALLEEKGKDA